MELAFQNSPLHFLRCVVQEVRFQEETAETIVPDSFPDIAAIADCYANPILRGKDCRDGSVTVAGGVKGVILYTPEDGSYPRRLEVYIPFSMKFEHPELSDHAQVMCSIRVRSVDARMINSRKAMLRVNLGCEISAYGETTDMLCTLQTECPELQTKTAAYQVSLPMETSEKSFVISDTLDISNNHPPISQIYKLHCQLEVTDQKLVGNKAVFKGLLHCKCLYLSDNENLYLYQQQLPFSQYCELQRDYDEETVSVLPMITGYDLEDALLSVNVLAQCVVSGKQTLQLLEDAYCTKGTLDAQWKEYAMDSCLDQQNSVQTVRQHLTGSLKEILDTDVYYDYPVMERRQEQVRVSVPVSLRVLGYHENGDLQVLTGKIEAVQEFMLSEGASCRIKADPTGEVYTAMAPDGAETRCGVSVSTSCYANQKLRTLCGGTVNTEDAAADSPSVIIRMIPKNTALWDVAKTYRATEAGIRAANHLEGELVPEDTMLLLPIG